MMKLALLILTTVAANAELRGSVRRTGTDALTKDGHASRNLLLYPLGYATESSSGDGLDEKMELQESVNLARMIHHSMPTKAERFSRNLLDSPESATESTSNDATNDELDSQENDNAALILLVQQRLVQAERASRELVQQSDTEFASNDSFSLDEQLSVAGDVNLKSLIQHRLQQAGRIGRELVRPESATKSSSKSWKYRLDDNSGSDSSDAPWELLLHHTMALKVQNSRANSRVLLPHWTTMSLWGFMEQVNKDFGPQYSTLQRLMVSAGKEDKMRRTSGITTLFAPDNHAISSELEDFLLLPENEDVLKETMDYHIVDKIVSYLSLERIASRADSFISNQGDNVEIAATTAGLFINKDTRVLAFTLAKQSILYRIDSVLVPPSLVNDVPVTLFSQKAVLAAPAFDYEYPIVIPESFFPAVLAADEEDPVLSEVLQSDFPSLTPVAWTDPNDPTAYTAPPTLGAQPSDTLSDFPSLQPSDAPSMMPSDAPSMVPSDAPSMLPSFFPTTETRPSYSLLDLISGESNLSWFTLLVELSDSTDQLMGTNSQYTVLAPDNLAFRDFDRDFFGRLLTPEYRLHVKDLIQYHLSPTELTVDEIAARSSIEMVLTTGGTVGVVQEANGDIFLETSSLRPAKILSSDRVAANGILQVIGHVLLPLSFTQNPITFMLQRDAGIEHSVFLSLIEAADLGDMLRDSQDITLFAPDDNAIPAEMVEYLTTEGNESILFEILMYHIIEKVVNFETLDVLRQNRFTTEQGERVTITRSGGIFVDIAVVLSYSLIERGIIYQIDSLLIPSSLAQKVSEDVLLSDIQFTLDSPTTVGEALSDMGMESSTFGFDPDENQEIFTLFSLALSLYGDEIGESAGLLGGDLEMTLFLPRLEGLASTDDEYGTNLMDPAYTLHLYALVANHATVEVLSESELPLIGKVEMASGGIVIAYEDRGQVFLDSSADVSATIVQSAEVEGIGFFHVIDQVLLPQWITFNVMSVLETFDVVVSPTYSMFRSLLVASRMDELLETADDVTLLAPENSAISQELVDFLILPENDGLLLNIITYHVTPKVVNYLEVAVETSGVMAVPTLQGSTLLMSVYGTEFYVNEDTLVQAVSLSRRAIVYRIGTLLIPTANFRARIPESLRPVPAVEVSPIATSFEFPIVFPADGKILSTLSAIGKRNTDFN